MAETQQSQTQQTQETQDLNLSLSVVTYDEKYCLN